MANGISALPYAQEKIILGTSFPLSAANAAPPAFTTTPPVSYLAVVDPNHVLPRTYEWNAAAEHGLGDDDVLTLTYLGASGRKLTRQDIYVRPNPNFTGEFDLIANGADSSYNALQAQYRHRLTHGLQALVSYTWGHSIDDASSDAYFLNMPPGKSPSSWSVVTPTTTSAIPLPARSPIPSPGRPTVGISRCCETGRWIPSCTPAALPR